MSRFGHVTQGIRARAGPAGHRLISVALRTDQSFIPGLFRACSPRLTTGYSQPLTSGAGARHSEGSTQMIEIARTWRVLGGGLVAGVIGVTAVRGRHRVGGSSGSSTARSRGARCPGGGPSRHRPHPSRATLPGGGATGNSAVASRRRLSGRLAPLPRRTRRRGAAAADGDRPGLRHAARLPAVQGRQARGAKARGFQGAGHHAAGARRAGPRFPIPMCPMRSR